MSFDEVVDPLAQTLGDGEPGIVEVTKILERGNLPGRGNTVEALKLLREFVRNDVTGVSHEFREAVAGGF
ncbi:hypothetical protein OAE61_04345, partial [Verrucomicrobiales bacterium]|nr:hypothetical protein [Verrucomicrobiales bacterium]